MKNVFLFLLSCLVFASCSTKKEILYFQNPETLNNVENLLDYEPVIERNDILEINVSSFNKEVAEPFQFQSSSQNQSGGGQQGSSQTGYLVDPDGNIQFPVIGKINVINKSKSELESVLTEKIREYVTDAVVRVRLVNFRITVLGEIAGGGTVIDVENERISFPELIAKAGGISYDGKRNNILVIREVDGVKTVGRVDLTSSKVFDNPFYYLKQNDIVYVEPTYRQVKSAGFITSYTGLISLATTIFGVIVLITR